MDNNADPLLFDQELDGLGASRPPDPIAKPDAETDDKDGAIAKLKALNAHAAKHPYVRRAKTVVFFCMALYGLITMLLEFGETFQKHPEFSTEHGEERCIPRFFEAAEYARNHPAAMVGFWVGAGTKRIAVCANATDADLDEAFADMTLFDPLSIVTPGSCTLDEPDDVADAVQSCVVTGNAAAPTRQGSCAVAFEARPAPRGVGWRYILKKMPKNPPRPHVDNTTTMPPLPTPESWSPNASSAANNAYATRTGRCRALVERNERRRFR